MPLEALLSGAPVIVADDSGCGEVITAVGGGVVVPLGDVDKLAGAIGQVIDHRERWQPQIAAAAARVRERYSPAAVVDALDGIYADAIGVSSPPLERCGVSFVVPVRNGAPWLRTTLKRIWAEATAVPSKSSSLTTGATMDQRGSQERQPTVDPCA